MLDTRKVVQAANHLIQAQNYTRLVNEITDIIERWDTHPMAYGGKLAHLNALIDVGLESREAFERLINLIERKRKLIPAAKRADYQRDLMRERRARIAKAIELRELTGTKLNASERHVYARELQERWRLAKETFLAQRGELTWAERNAATQEFWETVDRQLDANLRAARKPVTVH